jgi:hypothetical protein
VLLPVACVCLDPIVFQRRFPVFERGILEEFQILAYAGIGLEVFLLSAWLAAGKRLGRLGGFFAAAFAVGAAFSVFLGYRFFPASVAGLILFVGLLGFAPFLTAFIYARNAYRAFLCSRAEASPTLQMTTLGFGVALAVGLPAICYSFIEPFSIDALFKSTKNVRLTHVAFGPDSTVLVSAHPGGTLRTWNVLTGELLESARTHDGEITSIAFSPSESLVATGGADSTVRLWNPEAGHVRELGRHQGAVSSVAFSPLGDLVASGGSDTYLRIWSVDSGESRVLGLHGGPVTSVAFSPDGEAIATACEDAAVRLWDMRSGRRRFKFTGHSHPVTAVAFSPDGESVLSGSGWIRPDDAYPDGELLLWAPGTGELLKELQRLPSRFVIAVAFSPDGERIASGGWSEGCRGRFDSFGIDLIEINKFPHTFPFRHTLGRSSARPRGSTVAFSPNGKWVATGAHGDIVRLWDAESRALVRLLCAAENGSLLPASD